MKKQLINCIEQYAMSMNELRNETSEEIAFTTCDTKKYLTIKKLFDKLELDHNEEFEVDGGDPYYMIYVNNTELKKLLGL